MNIHAAFAATVLLAALPANAEILSTGSRVGNFTSSTVGTAVPVPINGAYYSVGLTTTVPNQIVRITYNAECAVASFVRENYLGIIIKVDGVEASPASGTQFGFCTATSESFAWVGAVRQSTLRIPHSGQHTVQVYGWMSATGTFWLGESSIVIDR